MNTASVARPRLKTLIALSALSVAVVSGCSTESSTSAGASGNLVADTYSALGNAPLTIVAAQGVLANDSGATAVTASDTASANGGTVAVSADGAFVYQSALGFSGTDTFQYSVGALSQTVTVNVNTRVWFVKNDVSASGDGSYSAPFQTLAEGEGALAAGDILYIFEGDGTDANLDTGLVLLDDVTVHGEGSALEVGGVTIIAAGNKPLLKRSGSGDAITIADRNVIQGVKIDGVADDSIDGDSFEGLTVNNVEIFNSSGNHLDHGIELSNAKTGTIAITNSKINTTAGNALDINLSDVSLVGQNVTLNISGNEFNSNDSNGVYFSLNEAGESTINMSSNTINSNHVNGIEINGDDDVKAVITLDSNTINGNLHGEGVLANFWNNAIVKFYLLSNTIQNHTGNYGLYVEAQDQSDVRTKVYGNTFLNNTASSIYLYSRHNSYFCAAVDNNSSDQLLAFQRADPSTFEREILNGNTGPVATIGAVSTGLPNGHCGL